MSTWFAAWSHEAHPLVVGGVAVRGHALGDKSKGRNHTDTLRDSS
jgi:hypothetical protein